MSEPRRDEESEPRRDEESEPCRDEESEPRPVEESEPRRDEENESEPAAAPGSLLQPVVPTGKYIYFRGHLLFRTCFLLCSVNGINHSACLSAGPFQLVATSGNVWTCEYN